MIRLKITAAAIVGTLLGALIGLYLAPHLVGWVSWLTVRHPAHCKHIGGWELLWSEYAPCNEWEADR